MLFHLRHKDWGMQLSPSVEVRISGVKRPFSYTFIVGAGTFCLEKLKAIENVKINP
jgi:hypothetical protein